MSSITQPQRAGVRRVADRLGARAGQPEVAAQRGAVVVVAGQHVDRRAERREQLARELVLRVRAVLRDVAGDEHRVRPQARRTPPTAAPAPRRVAAAPVRADVRVAELDDDRHSGSPSKYSRWSTRKRRPMPRSITLPERG